MNDELLLRAIERERAIVARTGQHGLRGSSREVADVHAVLRASARDATVYASTFALSSNW